MDVPLISSSKRPEAAGKLGSTPSESSHSRAHHSRGSFMGQQTSSHRVILHLIVNRESQKQLPTGNVSMAWSLLIKTKNRQGHDSSWCCPSVQIVVAHREKAGDPHQGCPLVYNHKAAGNWSSSKFGNLVPAQKTKIFWKQVHKTKN